jgi:hypothetical protein
MILPDSTRSVDKSTKRILELVEKVVAAELITFDAKMLPIAGNLDAVKVSDLAKRYGFSHKCTKKAQGGAVLLKVKTERNNLSHGEKSFSECGRDLTYQNLKSVKNRAVEYLRSILKNIEEYIANKRYAT